MRDRIDRHATKSSDGPIGIFKNVAVQSQLLALFGRAAAVASGLLLGEERT
jgi:hypothetical protein